MNGAVRAVVRMGIYVGAKVYFIHEVRRDSRLGLQTWPLGSLQTLFDRTVKQISTDYLGCDCLGENQQDSETCYPAISKFDLK